MSDKLETEAAPQDKKMENLQVIITTPTFQIEAPTEKEPTEKEPTKKITVLAEELKFCTELSNLVNREFFEGTLPPFIITFQKLKSAYGCASIRPVYQDDNFQYYQMTIDPSSAKMDGTLAAVIDTIIHENIHFYCRTNNILEVSNNGRYHNKKFKELAEKCGLTCTLHPTCGFNTDNKLSPKLIDLLLKNFKESDLEKLFKVSRPVKQAAPKTPQTDPLTGEPIETGTEGRRGGTNNNLTAYICPICGQKMRAGKNANFLCGNDNSKMIPVSKKSATE